jgi:hypothetical protein
VVAARHCVTDHLKARVRGPTERLELGICCQVFDGIFSWPRIALNGNVYSIKALNSNFTLPSDWGTSPTFLTQHLPVTQMAICEFRLVLCTLVRQEATRSARILAQRGAFCGAVRFQAGLLASW